MLAILCFHFEYVNYAAALVWVLVACKNGAGFYMEYFAKKYEN
jgi:hypothetical protein